ncbi:MAG: hypothetical protein ACI8TQ_003163 [Planctomycetota bacterium]|jgi:hypothetical protein
MKCFMNRIQAAAFASLPVVLAFAIAPTSSAQWDDTPFDPLMPVIEEGFVVIHENSLGINAFSAASQKWSTISPPGSSLLGSGDWTMLTKEPSGLYRGYSARRNNSATIGTTGIVTTFVDDDVILVIDSTAIGAFAHGYSAVYNTWATIPLLTAPASLDIAVSRFVAAVRDKNLYHGFAARTGAWSTLSLTDRGGSPSADGNTVLVNLLDISGTGIPNMAAFSGVRGSWAMSPPYDFPPTPMLDHNVASVRIRTTVPGMVSISAYTAYDATWVTSPVVHAPGFFSEALTDNVVLVSDSNPAIAFEAFGSRPATWATFGGNYSLLALDEDYAVLHHLANFDIVGYSGVCGGVWVPEPTPSGVAVVPIGTPDHQLTIRESTTLHNFLPATNSWSPLSGAPAGSVITGEDAMTDVRAGSFRANATRWGGWTGGPVAPAAPYAITSGGSVVAHQQLAGAGIGDIYAFDERCDMWVPPFNPGLVTTLSAGRNLLISDPGAAAGAPVHGYSVQRGDWTTPGPIATPLAVAPTTEENVAWLVDASGRLWGFGSPNVGHVYYAWPNGTEYHVSGNLPGTTIPPILGYSILGIPGTTGAYALISATKIPPTIFIPFAGFVCIDLTSFVNLGFFGVTDADCLRERLKVVPLPLPSCLQFWLQPLSFNFGSGVYTWEHRCDPAWFF